VARAWRKPYKEQKEATEPAAIQIDPQKQPQLPIQIDPQEQQPAAIQIDPQEQPQLPIQIDPGGGKV
jgi:hypothetical protein